jgi:hypothetical protein
MQDPWDTIRRANAWITGIEEGKYVCENIFNNSRKSLIF